MHRTTALLFWERCVPSVGQLLHQSFVTAAVREFSTAVASFRQADLADICIHSRDGKVF